MKKLLFAALLLISSSAECAWNRIASCTPIAGNNKIFVATYLHDGPLDYSLPTSSQLKFYLTAVYDYDLEPPMIYTRSQSISAKISDCQKRGVEWAIKREKRHQAKAIARLYDFEAEDDEDPLEGKEKE